MSFEDVNSDIYGKRRRSFRELTDVASSRQVLTAPVDIEITFGDVGAKVMFSQESDP